MQGSQRYKNTTEFCTQRSDWVAHTCVAEIGTAVWVFSSATCQPEAWRTSLE